MISGRLLIILSGALAVALAAFALYARHNNWHRDLVDYLYARMHVGELVAPGTVVMKYGRSPYDKWIDANRDSMPILDTLVLQDVNTVPVRPWPEMGLGIKGLYLRFSDYQITDGRLLEIPPGSSTLPRRHLYEMGAYILSGSGHTVISSSGRQDERVDWGAGSLLSVPVTDTYQHFNSGDEPVRMLSITSFPFLVNSFNDANLLHENDINLDERRAPPGQFVEFSEDTGEQEERRNFVQDVSNTATDPNPSRGISSRDAYWRMSGNSVLGMHISEFAPTAYKKAHRHSSEAFILIVSGEGYSLIWPETGRELTRIDWQPGTLFVPPTFWFHQHFNPGEELARYLVINTSHFVNHLGLRFYTQLEIDDPRVVEAWLEELRMPDARN